VQQDRDEEAKDVLERTRTEADVGDELGHIKDVASAQRRFRLRQPITPRMRPFLVIGVVLAFLQQAVGINAVIYFGATVLKFMGHSTNVAVYEAISLDDLCEGMGCGHKTRASMIVCDERHRHPRDRTVRKTDDLLKRYPDLAPWRPKIGLRPQLTDAGLVTLAVMRALLGYPSEAR
jgi:hypothetical protein